MTFTKSAMKITVVGKGPQGFKELVIISDGMYTIGDTVKISDMLSGESFKFDSSIYDFIIVPWRLGVEYDG